MLLIGYRFKKRLRDALGVLSEGLAMNLAQPGSSVKIAHGLNELQVEGPEDLKEDLKAVTSAVSSAIRRGDWLLGQQVIHQLTTPIRAKVRPLIEHKPAK